MLSSVLDAHVHVFPCNDENAVTTTASCDDGIRTLEELKEIADDDDFTKRCPPPTSTQAKLTLKYRLEMFLYFHNAVSLHP